MNLREVLAALRRSWWVVVVCALFAAGAGWGVSALQTPLFTSSTQFFVATTNSATTLEIFQGSQFSEQRVASYAQLVEGQELAARVVDRMGSKAGLRADGLAREIAATPVPETVLIDVSVTDPSAQRARDIAAALGQEFPALVSELETYAPGMASPVRVAVTKAPEVADAASSPKTARNTALGLAVGLALGAVIALLRVRLDRSVRDPEEASALAGSPVIGVVLRDESLRTRHTIDSKGVNRTAESYRQLRTNLQFLNVDDPPRVIMVSSAVPSEGKTTVAVNLAITLADARLSVTLVEGDLRRPRVTRYMGLIGGAGLTNILSGSGGIDDVVQSYGESQLKVIAAGATPPNPSELLSSSHMFRLIDQLRERSEFVLIDAPPLLPVADASGLAVIVDGVVLSVRYGKTKKDQLEQARLTLERIGARSLGIVLNIVPPGAQMSAAYGYGYNYSYDGGAAGAPSAQA